MKNNFNIRTFLTENKLTSNSKLLKEDFAPSPNGDVPDANAEEFDVATAFKKARVDMSKPVSVTHMYGHAQYASEDTDEMSAEAAIKMLEAERQERRKTYTDDGKEVPSDWHSYEFENSSVLEEDMPEGHEYKLAYFQTGDNDYAITQEKSGVSENKGEGLKDVEDGRDIGGKIIEFADGGNVDINIDYQRGKTKDFKDVPVEKAIDIVNQYIDQNDLTQASTDETNRILQVDDGDTAIDITKAGMSEKIGMFHDPRMSSGKFDHLTSKGKDHDQEIISYIADTYIQNAKGGDKAYAEFRDLNIRDAVQDVVGILQDPKHPLHDDTKEEYGIVEKDKARGLFENKMKNNFDLKNFLTENKLTSNSRLAEFEETDYVIVSQKS